MITVGVRELKAHLSHYLRLMQEGEEIAIQMRDTIIGYLYNAEYRLQKKSNRRKPTCDMKKLMKEWRKEGFLLSGGKPYKYCDFKSVKMTPGPTSTEIIRKMRDEE